MFLLGKIGFLTLSLVGKNRSAGPGQAHSDERSASFGKKGSQDLAQSHSHKLLCSCPLSPFYRHFCLLDVFFLFILFPSALSGGELSNTAPWVGLQAQLLQQARLRLYSSLNPGPGVGQRATTETVRLQYSPGISLRNNKEKNRHRTPYFLVFRGNIDECLRDFSTCML